VKLGRGRLAVGALAAALAVVLALSAWFFLARVPSPSGFAVPSEAGLNYGFPHTVDGEWVGTEWLRPSSSGESWDVQTGPALAADLDFIQRHNLGRVMRLFIGLDQAMVWDPSQGFVGFDEPTLEHFGAALDMLDARGMSAVAVIFDQEQVASSGNFRFAALDGNHPAWRQHYLTAVDTFLRRFGSRRTVIGWDLFNEAYNSLGRDGGLPPPLHDDPVSPGYSNGAIHAWLADLYRTAKNAAPGAMFTVSDTTELYWNPDPDLSKYQDVVDFYDVHVYDDNPRYPNWRWMLHKPYIVGEAGASTANQHYEDQAINSRAVTYLLDHAQPAGVSFVLVQGRTFTTDRVSLTPTGTVLAGYLSHATIASNHAAHNNVNPPEILAAALVSDVRRVWRWLRA